jgi:hypothetical protein
VLQSFLEAKRVFPYLEVPCWNQLTAFRKCAVYNFVTLDVTLDHQLLLTRTPICIRQALIFVQLSSIVSHGSGSSGNSPRQKVVRRCCLGLSLGKLFRS